MTSQRCRPVVRLGYPDMPSRLYAGVARSYRRCGAGEMVVLHPPLHGAAYRPRRRRRLVLAHGSRSMNDVIDHRRQHFPTPTDRPTAMTVGHYGQRQPLFRRLERSHLPQHAPSSLAAFWRHHPDYREQHSDNVRQSGRARQPRRRRVLPPIPSDLSSCSRLVTARTSAADFRQKPIFLVAHRYDSNDDSISV